MQGCPSLIAFTRWTVLNVSLGSMSRVFQSGSPMSSTYSSVGISHHMMSITSQITSHGLGTHQRRTPEAGAAYRLVELVELVELVQLVPWQQVALEEPPQAPARLQRGVTQWPSRTGGGGLEPVSFAPFLGLLDPLGLFALESQ